MRFNNKNDKLAIQYNPNIRITNIPLETYDYVVNGRSAFKWIMERYQVRLDNDSKIKNDPNDWAIDHKRPRYTLDLLFSIINVNMKTNEIVKGLSKLAV